MTAISIGTHNYYLLFISLNKRNSLHDRYYIRLLKLLFVCSHMTINISNIFPISFLQNFYLHLYEYCLSL